MKNIKFLFILLFQFAAFQFAIGQSTQVLDQGRSSGVAPATASPTAANIKADVYNGGDQDVPGQVNAVSSSEDFIFPDDLDDLRTELYASDSPQAVVAQVNLLTQQVEALILANEQLRKENQAIRKNLSNCCSSSELGVSSNDAYLLQNAPNPFQESSEIHFFIPEGLENVQLEIRNVKGETLKSFDLEQRDLGKLDINGQNLESGTYIYTLVVDGKVIDSKVMILTQ